MLHYRKSFLSRTMLATGALTLVAGLASSQAKKPRRDAGGGLQSVPGQILLYCQPNTAQNDVNRLATLVNGQVTPLLLADGYLLTLDAAHTNQAATSAAIAQLRVDASVRGVGPNNIPTKRQVSGGTTNTISPNDPRYVSGQQYALGMINMPQAWVLQKGNINYSVAVIDSGCDPKHEDTPIISPGSFDIADNDSDPTADGSDPPGEFDHGTGVSGVMLAHTNNAKGIAGVIWNQMPLFMVKEDKKGGSVGDTTVQINSFAYVAKNAAKYNIVAVNYSIGAHAAPSQLDPSGMLQAAQQSCMAAGVHVVEAAGNDGLGGPDSSDVPGVVKVSAVGKSPSALTYYSNFDNITIAAPGGEQKSGPNDPNGVMVMNQSTAPSPQLYSYEQGTSFASPHVAAVLALLRSVPGVDYNRALSALLSGANHSITGQASVPDNKFGAGLLDAYASLAKVSNVVIIDEPQGVDPATNTSTAPAQANPLAVETLRPLVRFEVNNAKVVNGAPQVNVTLTTPSGTRALITNGAVDSGATSLIANFYVKDVSTDPTFPQFIISFRYIAGTSVTAQQQQISVVSTPNDPTFTPAQASLVFNVSPHIFPAGVSMVSFPVAETPPDSPDANNRKRDIQQILNGGSAILYRWVNAPVVDAKGKQTVQGQYAIKGSGSADNLTGLASLHPTDVTTTPVPTIDPRDNPADPASAVTDATPVGLGYFINLTAGAAVQTYGRTFTQQTIRVPLHEGWNMIGDPFQFPIAFANLTVQAPNGTLYASSDAVTAKLILPFIYRFVGTEYEFQALPNGTLNPWEGNWIYVIPKDVTSVNSSPNALTLVMTPTQAGTTRGVRALGAKNTLTRAIQTTTKPDVRGPGSWALRLVARSNNLVDSYNYIGMSSTAKDDDDLTKAPKPPRFGSNVTLGLQRGANNGLYAQDLRSLGGTKTWGVVVTTDHPNSDVTVSWPDAHSLPRNYQFTLKDNLTGQVVDIRNRSTFQFNSGPKAQAREFTITAQPGNSGDRVVFNSVFVAQRGLSKATGQSTYQIDYNMSHNAQVDISILNPGGRVITQLDSGRAATSGDNHVIWNGRDGQNHAVPSGSYIVRFRAVSSEGRVTQYHYPLTVTGR